MTKTELAFEIYFKLISSPRRRTVADLASDFQTDKQRIQRSLDFLCDECRFTKQRIFKKEKVNKQKCEYFVDRKKLLLGHPDRDHLLYDFSLELVTNGKLAPERREAFLSLLTSLYKDTYDLASLTQLSNDPGILFKQEQLETLCAIFSAINNQNQIKVEYEGVEKPLIIKPLLVFIKFDHIMMAGLNSIDKRENWKNQIKTYRLSKMNRLDQLEKQFFVPDLQSSDVRNKIEELVLKPAEVVLKFHDTRGLSLIPLLRLEGMNWNKEDQTLTFYMNNTTGLSQLILSMGSFVEVLKPETQRTTMQRIYRKALSHYRSKEV